MEPRFCFTGKSDENECGSEAIDSLELLVLPLVNTEFIQLFTIIKLQIVQINVYIFKND